MYRRVRNVRIAKKVSRVGGKREGFQDLDFERKVRVEWKIAFFKMEQMLEAQYFVSSDELLWVACEAELSFVLMTGGWL